ALRRKARGHPVELAAALLIHLSEPEALEPPRGPGGHVSSDVPAVDDHRAIRVQRRRCIVVETPQRDADRFRQMVLRVLLLRQHLDELGTRLDQAPQLVAIDLRGHLYLPLDHVGPIPRPKLRGLFETHLPGSHTHSGPIRVHVARRSAIGSSVESACSAIRSRPRKARLYTISLPRRSARTKPQ